MFSDGFCDALNKESRRYGLERLKTLLANEARDVGELGARIVDGVRQYVGEQAQADDLCLVCLTRASP